MSANDKLIRELNSCLSSKKILVKELAHSLHLTERSIYNRLNGITEFSLTEFEILKRKFKINTELIFEELTDSLLPNKYKNEEEFYQFITNQWIEEVKKIEPYKNSEVFIISNNLPFSLIFEFPDLLKFRLFYLYNSFFLQQHKPIQKLELDNPKFKSFENSCSRINDVYSTKTSTEIWGPSLIKIFVRQLNHFYSRSLLSYSLKLKLLEELYRLIDKAEKFSFSGKKDQLKSSQFIDTNPSYHLFYNDLFNVAEYTILTHVDKDSEVYSIYSPLSGTIRNSLEKGMIKQYYFQLKDSGININHQIPIERELFFDDLKSYINAARTESL